MEEGLVMQYKEILFTAIIGSIIGYITNWLAIKMLFRPRTEKRIFGIKVPFTPGLIPKEQKRMASSIGDAVGNHLLTTDTMIQAIEDNGIDEKFGRWVEAKVLELETSNESLGEQIKHIIGEKYSSFKSYIKIKVAGFVLETIKKEKFKKEMQKMLLQEIKNELNNSPQTILDSQYYKKIRSNLLENANEYKNSEDFKKNIQNIIETKMSEFEKENKTLKEILPADFVSTLKVYIYSKNYDIAMTIKQMLKDENIQLKIKHALSDMISSNLNSMVAMFLNPDMIYAKLLPAIEDYLDKEDTHREIALLINELIDKGLENRVSDIFYNLSEEAKKRNAKNISEAIAEKVIDDKLIDSLILDLEEKLKESNTIEEVLQKLDIDLEELIENFIGEKISCIMNSKEIEDKIEMYVDNFVEDTLNMPLKDMFKGNKKSISKASAELAEEVFETFLKTRGIEFLNAFDISKIVEDKINIFDITFTENLILTIASKELEAITWLGALLGFAMGLVSAILSRL